MGELINLYECQRGDIYVWTHDRRKFEAAYESPWGSWNWFATFALPEEAIAYAHDLNAREFGGCCMVLIDHKVTCLLSAGGRDDPRTA